MSGGAEVRMLRTIIEVQQAINDADPTTNSVMHIVLTKAREATRAPGAVVELAENDEMVYTAAAGSLSGTEGLRLALSGSLSGMAVSTGEVLVAEDTETDPRVNLEACRRVGARSMVAVPLLHDTRTLGVLKLVSDQPNAFSEDDVSLLEQLADFIASALRRATVVEERTQAAQIDSLTGLATRAAFLAGLERAVLAAATSQQVAAVLYLDLDGFKPVNDTYGHAVGDEVLSETGHRITANCRDTDLAARIGGDEFAVLLIASHRAALSEIRDRLLGALHETFLTSAGPVRIGASCGMAVVSGGDLAASVLARADAAMYADKRTRREKTA